LQPPAIILLKKFIIFQLDRRLFVGQLGSDEATRHPDINGRLLKLTLQVTETSPLLVSKPQTLATSCNYFIKKFIIFQLDRRLFVGQLGSDEATRHPDINGRLLKLTLQVTETSPLLVSKPQTLATS